jgi:hypothetical protein
MGFSGFEEERVEPQPWALEGAGDVAFAVLWATGTDTALDGVFRLEALRRREGEWQRFERLCRPFAKAADSTASARMVREYGVSAADLEGAPRPEAAWKELAVFRGRRRRSNRPSAGPGDSRAARRLSS